MQQICNDKAHCGSTRVWFATIVMLRLREHSTACFFPSVVAGHIEPNERLCVGLITAMKLCCMVVTRHKGTWSHTDPPVCVMVLLRLCLTFTQCNFTAMILNLLPKPPSHSNGQLLYLCNTISSSLPATEDPVALCTHIFFFFLLTITGAFFMAAFVHMQVRLSSYECKCGCI